MIPNGGDFLVGKFTRDDQPGSILLLERDGEAVAIKKPEGTTVHQKSAPEGIALVRDVLGLLGWNETACLRPFTEDDLL